MAKLTHDQVIEKLRKGESLAGDDLSGLNLFMANIPEADLSKANLLLAKLSGANLSRANLSGANLSKANITRAKLSEADLSGANVYRAYLFGANLSEANLSEANLSEANLSGAKLHKANLSGANLSEVNLQEADLRLSQLSNADLSGADFTGAKLYGVEFGYAKLDNIKCEWYDISPEGNGSDIHYPKAGSFADIFRTPAPQTTITSLISDAEIDPDLLIGFSGLDKVMQVLGASVSKFEKTLSRGSSISLEAREENVMLVVLILFNVLVKGGAVKAGLLSRDMGQLKRITINGKPLVDLLQDMLKLIDSSSRHYKLLEKFRQGFVSMDTHIRKEVVSVKRRDKELYLEYCSCACKPQVEDKSVRVGKELVEDVMSALDNGKTGVAVAKILKYILTVSD